MSLTFEFDLLPGKRRKIGAGAPVFIIGEIGTNWFVGDSNDDSAAKELILAAAAAGCDAVKFQTYRPETVYVGDPGPSDYLKANDISTPLMELLRKSVMPEAMIAELAAFCAKNGIGFMSSAFSTEDLKLIDPYCGIHKLASYEISHIRLIEALARTGKPLIMSTGATEIEEIEWAVAMYRSVGGEDLVINQCCAAYPAPESAINLKVIPWLLEQFDAVPGYSDHTAGPITAPVAAVALGAKLIEKHITLDRSLEGPDHFNSIEPNQLAQMVKAIRETEELVGDGIKKVEEVEKELFDYANRHIQALRDIEPGEVLSEDNNMGILRPGARTSGAHPKFIDRFNGRRVKRRIPAYEGIHESMLESEAS